MSHINRATEQARDANIIAGIQKHLQSVTSISLDGVAYAPADLVKLFQSQIDQANACTAAKTAFLNTVKAKAALDAEVKPILELLQSYVGNAFGRSSQAFGDFGFTLRKSNKVQNTEDKAAAAKKREATRKVRNTMGSRQKEKVKGTVEVPVASLAPVATGPANGASPAPPPNGATPSHP